MTVNTDPEVIKALDTCQQVAKAWDVVNRLRYSHSGNQIVGKHIKIAIEGLGQAQEAAEQQLGFAYRLAVRDLGKS